MGFAIDDTMLLDYPQDGKENGVRPLPCIRIGDKWVAEMPIKKHFAKINEELDELKEAIIGYDFAGCKMTADAGSEARLLFEDEKWRIAEEGIDTITTITTMLEALGIDVKMRDEVQRQVNEKNRERGRL